MKPFLIVVAVASLLFLAVQPRTASKGAAVAAQGGRPQTPPGWSQMSSKALDLSLEGKDLEVLAMYETWVAKHPDFGDGHFRLGAAHESVARALSTSRAPDAQTARAKHLEAAVMHIGRALQLGGPDSSSFVGMRGLIDLHGIGGLNRPAEYERLVRASITRYPAEPLAHAYLLEILATKGEPIAPAARAARAAMPRGADGRVALAGALVAYVKDYGRLTPAVAPTLLPEASRLIEEALTLKPGHAEALAVRSDIEALQENSSRLPLADEAGLRGAMRAIVSAQATYAAVCGHGLSAPTLADLARPEPGKKLGFLAADLAPATGGASIEKYHYRIEMTAVASPRSAASCNGVAAGRLAETFAVVARPLEGFRGRGFRIDADGKLTEIK